MKRYKLWDETEAYGVFPGFDFISTKGKVFKNRIFPIFKEGVHRRFLGFSVFLVRIKPWRNFLLTIVLMKSLSF